MEKIQQKEDRRRPWVRTMGGLVAAGALVVAAGCGVRSVQHDKQPRTTAGKVLATYQAPANGLVTNEYATYNPEDTAAKKSPDWTMTSGSLFARDGAFWTGKPDSCDAPNADSTNCTNSDVFRLNSVQKYSGNLSVSVAVKQNSEIHNPACDANDSCWHGAHIWLDYQSEYDLYYVSVNRADDTVVIKRKIPCGDDNHGTYKEISPYVTHPFKTNQWNTYRAALHHNTDGSNSVSLYDSASGAKPIVTGTDHGGTNPNWSADCDTPGKYPGHAYPPLGVSGSVGLRGDFTDMQFKDFTVFQQ
jgi:hypothetical protein